MTPNSIIRARSEPNLYSRGSIMALITVANTTKTALVSRYSPRLSSMRPARFMATPMAMVRAPAMATRISTTRYRDATVLVRPMGRDRP